MNRLTERAGTSQVPSALLNRDRPKHMLTIKPVLKTFVELSLNCSGSHIFDRLVKQSSWWNRTNLMTILQLFIFFYNQTLGFLRHRLLILRRNELNDLNNGK